jgi:hypothetical protein
MTRDQAVAFLNEAARYFGKRPTGGEDAAFWANVTNSENCLKIAAMLQPEDGLKCLFCGGPTGDDPIMDDHGETACRPCGEAEIETQKKDGFWPFVNSIGR